MNIKNHFDTITFSLNEEIGILTINRPKKLNALNGMVFTELKEVLTEITSQKNYQIKGLLLIGEGEKAFIAGADILEMTDMSKEEAKAFSQFGQEVSLLIENLPIPVISLVNGFALGGGLEMALSADFIYASKNAIFGLPEVGLGLIPGFGGTQRLSRVIGCSRAKELVYTAGKIDAEKAHDYGLVLEIFENREELLQAGIKAIKLCMRNSPLAITTAKIAMSLGENKLIQDGLKIEAEEFQKLFGTKDMSEGTSAFIEKRRASFVGA